MFSKSLLKIISISSFITGLILGIFTLIPPVIWIIFILLMFCISPFIIVYLKKLNLIKNIEIEQCLAIGALSGAASFVGFSVVFFPLAFILNLIFNTQFYIWIKVLLQNISFLLPMIFFIALLSAILNMFSGFLTAYFYQYTKVNK